MPYAIVYVTLVVMTMSELVRHREQPYKYYPRRPMVFLIDCLSLAYLFSWLSEIYNPEAKVFVVSALILFSVSAAHHFSRERVWLRKLDQIAIWCFVIAVAVPFVKHDFRDIIFGFLILIGIHYKLKVDESKLGSNIRFTCLGLFLLLATNFSGYEFGTNNSNFIFGISCFIFQLLIFQLEKPRAYREIQHGVLLLGVHHILLALP